MLTDKTWNFKNDQHSPELLGQLRKQLAPGKSFHTIWCAHGGGLFQVGLKEDGDKAWRPSVLYVKKDGAKPSTIYAIQIDTGLPLLLTGRLEGQVTQWLEARPIVAAFRNWAEAEVSPSLFKDLWADVAAGILSRILINGPSTFVDLLTEWAGSKKMFGPTVSPDEARDYSRIDVWAWIRADFENSRAWVKLSREARLYVLIVVGTEFSRRWPGWDKKKGK